MKSRVRASTFLIQSTKSLLPGEAEIPLQGGGTASHKLEISFVIEEQAPPATLGLPHDQRTLGLGFQKIVLVGRQRR